MESLRLGYNVNAMDKVSLGQIVVQGGYWLNILGVDDRVGCSSNHLSIFKNKFVSIDFS